MAIYTDYKTISTTIIDANAINNAIKNIILTPLGSLPGKPTFGSNLYQIPFNQLDDILQGNIEIYITEALSKWEPRIAIKDITVKSLPEFNKTIVTLEYIFKDRGLVLNERLNINLTN